MDAIPQLLRTAAENVRAGLDAAARATAISPAAPSAGSGGGPSAMAAFARGAIFADAVDAATHARLEELKAAVR